MGIKNGAVFVGHDGTSFVKVRVFLTKFASAKKEFINLENTTCPDFYKFKRGSGCDNTT